MVGKRQVSHQILCPGKLAAGRRFKLVYEIGVRNDHFSSG